MSQSKNEISGHMQAKEQSDTFKATGTVEDAMSAIEISRDIPVDAKQAIKDFVQDKFEEIINFETDLIDFPVPEELIDLWPIVIELLKGLGL